MDDLKPVMRIKIWLEQDEEMVFGPGCAMLLREIDNCGSLSSAVKNLKMSYRAAWGHLKKVEDTLGVALVVKTGGNKGGFSLSKQGVELLGAYERWNQAMKQESLKLAQELFPWKVKE